MKDSPENQRAVRIIIMTNEIHLMVSGVYESLVDGEYDKADREIKWIIRELKSIQKLIKDEDF